MPTRKQLSRMWETEFEYPSTRREDDPAYVPPNKIKSLAMNTEIPKHIQQASETLFPSITHEGLSEKLTQHILYGLRSAWCSGILSPEAKEHWKEQDGDYWKERCSAAEKLLEVSGYNPVRDRIVYHYNQWQEFKNKK